MYYIAQYNLYIAIFININIQKSNIMHHKGIIETLKLRRITLQTTQETLSILSGVSLRTVKQFESGKGNPTLETLQKIADILGLEIKLEIKKLVTEDEKSNDSI